MTSHQTAMQWVMTVTACVIIPLVLAYRDNILGLIAHHPNIFLLLMVIIAMVFMYLKLSKGDDENA